MASYKLWLKLMHRQIIWLEKFVLTCTHPVGQQIQNEHSVKYGYTHMALYCVCPFCIDIFCTMLVLPWNMHLPKPLSFSRDRFISKVYGPTSVLIVHFRWILWNDCHVKKIITWTLCKLFSTILMCVLQFCTFCLLNSSYAWLLHKCTPQQAVALTIF